MLNELLDYLAKINPASLTTVVCESHLLIKTIIRNYSTNEVIIKSNSSLTIEYPNRSIIEFRCFQHSHETRGMHRDFLFIMKDVKLSEDILYNLKIRTAYLAIEQFERK